MAEQIKDGGRDAENVLRRILARANHRTDGDLPALLNRVEHLTNGDRDLIAMQRGVIADLDEDVLQLKAKLAARGDA